MQIKIAKGLSFPAVELATEVIASLGQRGGGKSNGAAVVAEGLLAAGVPVIVLDYVGIWFSLRLAADGKTPSPFQIPVLGGPHGDIGLISTTGALVAEALARTQSSAVLDISLFSKGDRCRFATDFAEAFFRAKKDHPGPVQLLLEEAQRFVPQKLFSGQGMERMLGAFEEIAEVGRNYGVGLHLISQRPQKINKDVLNLADTVFGYRSNGVLERKAISEWVQEKGAEGRADVHDELPGLERGSAIVWCPSRKIFGRYAIEKKTTYDAGATPIAARAAVKTKPLELDKLEAAMGKAVEEAKANDPKALRVRIAELERQVARPPAAGAEVIKTVHVIPAAILEIGTRTSAARLAAQAAIVELEKALGTIDAGLVDATRAAGEASREIVDYRRQGRAPGTSTAPLLGVEVAPAKAQQIRERLGLPVGTRVATMKAPDRWPRPSHPPTDGDEKLPKGALEMLAALATSHVDSMTRRQVATLSGIKVTGGTFAKYLSILNTGGYLEVRGPDLRLTEAGRARAGDVEIPADGAALLAFWERKVPAGARVMLRHIVQEASDGISDQDWAAAAEIEASGGTFAKYKSLLITRGLVEKRDRLIYPSELFNR